MGAGIRAAALPFMLATLGACGGGGGGGGGVVPTEAVFNSFAAAAPNQTVVMQGTSVTLSGTAVTTATSVDNGPIDTATTMKFTYDNARQLSGVSFSSPQASLNINRAAGGTVSCGGTGACKAENASAVIVTVDPFVAGWNYQAFGVWAQETGPTTFKLGAVSAGNPTSGSSLPTTGTATFNGITTGSYIDPGGNLFATGAAMRAEVNFGTRNIGFSTSGTTKNGIADNGLNLSGTLSYAQGVNSFNGPLQTQNGQLSGQGAGRFFGPAAEEIGGVYSLSGPAGSVTRMVGGFGGRR